ncbi:LVIVD repeat-containing protein [Carboxylicivirga sp. RSCT41]|uniref:LVIVD repeat-containing protein n=1 Tax=Carboxylicivirga agarovorans TaxID=3417570 RepID=UPI003D3342EF
MKTLLKLSFVVMAVLSLSACSDKIKETYTVNTPEYLSYDDLRSSFQMKSAQTIIQPGKIYFKDHFIFINEYQKGIHIIDNADPANPRFVSFLELPGNVDMAIKGNMLYADSYIDLVTIDISDMNNIREVDRDEEAFPYIIPGFENGVLSRIDQSKGVITGYKVTEETVEVDRNDITYGVFPRWESSFFAADALSSAKVNSTGNGTGGSMARFTLYGDYLYAIDNASLHLFDVSDNSNPNFTKQIPISWQIETLFPYNQLLFIGAQSGMFIYSLQNPGNPEYISEFRHATACDPVVVEGDYAYVTLRGGNLCGAIESQLDVIDISVIENPEMVKSYSMKEPYGLGIDDDVLFICDGNAGLKIYDASDPLTITDKQIAHYPDVNSYDVIPLGEVLLLIGTDGLYQYDYSDLDNIELLSHIKIYQ